MNNLAIVPKFPSAWYDRIRRCSFKAYKRRKFEISRRKRRRFRYQRETEKAVSPRRHQINSIPLADGTRVRRLIEHWCLFEFRDLYRLLVEDGTMGVEFDDKRVVLGTHEHDWFSQMRINKMWLQAATSFFLLVGGSARNGTVFEDLW